MGLFRLMGRIRGICKDLCGLFRGFIEHYPKDAQDLAIWEGDLAFAIVVKETRYCYRNLLSTRGIKTRKEIHKDKPGAPLKKELSVISLRNCVSKELGNFLCTRKEQPSKFNGTEFLKIVTCPATSSSILNWKNCKGWYFIWLNLTLFNYMNIKSKKNTW